MGLLELGDECLQQNAIFEYNDYKVGDPIIDGNAETKELHCIYNYYIETQPNGLNYYKCLKKEEICAEFGYNYFDSKTNECLHKCPISQPKLTELKKGDNAYYRCSEECDYIDEEGNKYDKRIKNFQRNRALILLFILSIAIKIAQKNHVIILMMIKNVE